MPVPSTIFAASSGSGRAALTVLRLSGADSGMVLRRLCKSVPPPRRASLRRLRDETGNLLDRAVVVWLPGPDSYTGEDMAELSLHGGHAVLEAVSGALLRLGARPAEPGAFTRRAFLAGRMDLLEAEAVGDLVDAETEMLRQGALRQLEGDAARLLEAWAGRLRQALAFQEALLDFPGEAISDAIEAELAAGLALLSDELALHAAAASRIARHRDGLVFAIVGPPNAGKSSLMNVLARRDVAIVAATPGTTRDAVEASVVIAGVKVTLVDTAGLRETADTVEAEGVRRARARAASADLVLHVTQAGTETPAPAEGPDTIWIANKIDLAPAPQRAMGVSALTGEGLSALEDALGAEIRQRTASSGGPGLSRVRHAAALLDAEAAIRRALAVRDAELRAEELRVAMAALGRITGAVDSEAVLDTIFSSFCIGK